MEVEVGIGTELEVGIEVEIGKGRSRELTKTTKYKEPIQNNNRDFSEKLQLKDNNKFRIKHESVGLPGCVQWQSSDRARVWRNVARHMVQMTYGVLSYSPLAMFIF